jgi:Tol biopolymer transport system component/imidazolonepropionase-like amidohydrolase
MRYSKLFRVAFFGLVAGAAFVSAPSRAWGADPPAEAPPEPSHLEPDDLALDINQPRANARKVAFEVSEGTWMSLDVSPDGKTIVFDLLGDIYSMPVTGGRAKALTRGPGYDTHPRFSPDGKTIAFTSDRGGMENLWLMGRDGGSPRAITDEKDAYVRSAVWLPDGISLLARREDAKRAGIPPVELWLFNREGGAGVKLTSSDDLNNAAGPAVAKSGRFFYFSMREKKFSYTADLANGLWQVARYDRWTGESIPVTSGFGGAVRPAVSPDGKTLTFVSRRDGQSVLIARNLESGAERTLVRGVTRDEQEGFAALDLWPNYAFTPDSRALIFGHHGKIVRLDLGTLKMTDIPFVAPVEQWLAPRVTWQERVENGPVEVKILRWPNLSPDGKWLVFDALGRVWLQALDKGKAAGTPRRLTPDGGGLPSREYAPTFSPDGKSIAYVSWNDQTGGHIWKTPVPSSPTAAARSPQKLTRAAGHYMNPQFSPQSDRLLFVRGSGLELRGRQPEEEEVFEIAWINASGGDAHVVTPVKRGESLRFHPDAYFNADGTRVYFRDPVEAKKPTDPPKNDLVSVLLDGSDKRRLVRFPAVGEVVPSPDEHWIVFTSRDNVYVTAMPAVATKEPPEVALKDSSLPVFRLSSEAGGFVRWAERGRSITWSLGRSFYQLPLESALAFARERKQKELAEAKAAHNEKEKDKPKPQDKNEPIVAKAAVVEIHLSAPRATPKGSIVLHGARVITMKKDEVIEEADVVITGNRIAAIGPVGKVAIPSGARTFDARGKTIIPGLIDTHAHLHYSSFELFPDAKWEYIANLAYGVTTVYDPSARSLDVFAQGEMVEAGLMMGPRVYSSGDVLYGGQQADIFAEVNNQEDALRQVKRMKAYGARMIKVYQQPRRSQRLWFAEACRKEHILLTAEGAGEMQTDLSMATDGFTAFEHALPIQLGKDVIQLLARSETYYTPTLLVAYGGPDAEHYFYQLHNPHDDSRLLRFTPHFALDGLGRRHPWIALDEYSFPTVAQGAAEVARAGGRVSLGAHGQLQGLGAHWELWAMAGDGGSAAMTALEALRASTIAAADKLGFSPDLGSLEVGKLADMVVLDHDPRKDIHATAETHWVVKNGELFDAATMRELWPREVPLAQFYWQMQAPERPTTR